MFLSQYYSFSCQYYSTIAPYPFIHLPPTLYNVFLPILQFPLSVSFHHCSIPISILCCTVIRTRIERTPVTLQPILTISDIGKNWQKMPLEHSRSCLRAVTTPSSRCHTASTVYAADGSDRCHPENRTSVPECLTELS
jgi:hypothetical protein